MEKSIMLATRVSFKQPIIPLRKWGTELTCKCRNDETPDTNFTFDGYHKTQGFQERNMLTHVFSVTLCIQHPFSILIASGKHRKSSPTTSVSTWHGHLCYNVVQRHVPHSFPRCHVRRVAGSLFQRPRADCKLSTKYRTAFEMRIIVHMALAKRCWTWPISCMSAPVLKLPYTLPLHYLQGWRTISYGVCSIDSTHITMRSTVSVQGFGLTSLKCRVRWTYMATRSL